MEWCAAVCVPLSQAATLWQVENRIRGVECIIPYACLQFSRTELVAFLTLNALKMWIIHWGLFVCHCSKYLPYRTVILRLSGLPSAQLALHLSLSAISSSLLSSKPEPHGWLVNSSEAGEKKKKKLRSQYADTANSVIEVILEKTTLKHLFMTCNCCINCFYYLSSSTYYLGRLY